MNATSAFHTRLRQALERRAISQTELARQLEVRVATVNEWLNRGTMPSGPIMLRLPGVLAVDGHWLLTGERKGEGGEAPATPESRERVYALLEEALRLLGSSGPGAAADAGELTRVRRPREDERLALEAVERHRRGAETPERKRKSG